MDNRFDRPNRRETKIDLPPNLDQLTVRWFDHPPKELVDLSGATGELEHAQPATPEWSERVSNWVKRGLDSRLARMVPVIAAMFSVSCEMQAEQLKSVDTSTIVPLELTEDHGDVVITLNADHAIRISDYANRTQWDAALPEAGHHAVEQNATYQLHAAIMHDQYQRSLNQVDTAYVADAQGPLNTTTKYTLEPSRMYPGEYPSYSDVYGNLSLGDAKADEEYTRNYIEGSWLISAQKHFGERYQTVQDLEQLTAAEWMVVLQEPATELTYDPSLTSLYPEYDAVKTEQHNKKTIAALIEASVGVCRDFERINITSYALADEMFDLSERGLLYMPQVNMSDAAHTEGMFLFAKSASETIVVGVNTTDSTADHLNNFIAIPDTVAWYTQQYSKEFVDSPEHAITAYQGLLEIVGGDMNPTARAMLTREVVLANLRAAEAADTKVTKKVYLEEAFRTLQSQLIEESAVTTATLDRPSRMVPLYDLLLATAKAYDEVDISTVNGLHTVAARTLFESYLQQHAKVDLESARGAIDMIDRSGTEKERNRYYNQLIHFLEGKR